MTQAARVWKGAQRYEGAWPIRAYTAYWIADRRKHKARHRDRDNSDDEYHPSEPPSRVRVDKGKGVDRSSSSTMKVGPRLSLFTEQ